MFAAAHSIKTCLRRRSSSCKQLNTPQFFNTLNTNALVRSLSNSISSASVVKGGSGGGGEQGTSSELKDEYDTLTSEGLGYTVEGTVTLEDGSVIANPHFRYKTWGNPENPTLLICHALTGNADVSSWWGALLDEKVLNLASKYHVVGYNLLGSCYGSTGPTSLLGSSDRNYIEQYLANKGMTDGVDVNEIHEKLQDEEYIANLRQSNNPLTFLYNEHLIYGMQFPMISVQDQMSLVSQFLQGIGVKEVESIIGGSFGGMQTLDLAVQSALNPQTTIPIKSIMPIATNAYHSAWQIGISETQRQAIFSDPNYKLKPFNATQGLHVARQIGMVSYRTAVGYQGKFGRNVNSQSQQYEVQRYLEYQGNKFNTRMDPVSYIKLTQQMDTHDVARNRVVNNGELEDPQLKYIDREMYNHYHMDGLASVLSQVKIPARVLGITSDILYPLQEQQLLADFLPNSELGVIQCLDGHDGFLTAQDQVCEQIQDFLNSL